MTVIAIDGPAGSGKGTLARRLADELGLRHLDTGLLYRATGAKLLAQGGNADDTQRALAAARALDLASIADEPALRTEEAGSAASMVAAMPEVRAALLQMQRDFSAEPPGAVLDGRDIGTVVCPDAELKIFLTAASEARAKRRFQELRAAGEPSIYADILKDVEERDWRDTNRADAPLKPAVDAHVIDTTLLDADEVLAQALEKINDLKPSNRCT